jgi:2-haloacid dehalogenase/putative hydrolase of the HAD superfamily
VQTLEPLGKSIDPWPYVSRLTAYWGRPPLHEDARPFLEAVAGLGLSVCLVSNADRADVDAALAHHDLTDLVGEVVTSEDARVYKPLPGIFELALRQTGWNRQHVVHIGDSLHSDVGGALAAAIPAVWLNRPGRISDVGNHSPHHEVCRLTDLLPAIAEHAEASRGVPRGSSDNF